MAGPIGGSCSSSRFLPGATTLPKMRLVEGVARVWGQFGAHLVFGVRAPFLPNGTASVPCHVAMQTHRDPAAVLRIQSQWIKAIQGATIVIGGSSGRVDIVPQPDERVKVMPNGKDGGP